MLCVFCKGNMRDGFDTYVAEVGESVVIIKGVPCQKCDQCGEVSYKGFVYKRVEGIVEEIKNIASEVAIVKYAEKAA